MPDPGGAERHDACCCSIVSAAAGAATASGRPGHRDETGGRTGFAGSGSGSSGALSAGSATAAAGAVSHPDSHRNGHHRGGGAEDDDRDLEDVLGAPDDRRDRPVDGLGGQDHDAEPRTDQDRAAGTARRPVMLRE